MPDYEKLYYALFSDLSRIIDILEIVRQNAETRFLAAVEEGAQSTIHRKILLFTAPVYRMGGKKSNLLFALFHGGQKTRLSHRF